MKTYTTKIAKNGATLYYSVETGKRIAKETALDNEREYIIQNGTVAERYELAKEWYDVEYRRGTGEAVWYTYGARTVWYPHGKSMQHATAGYTTKSKTDWHEVDASSLKVDLERDYNLTLDEFKAAKAEAEVEAEVEAEAEVEVEAEAEQATFDAKFNNGNVSASQSFKTFEDAKAYVDECERVNGGNFVSEIQKFDTNIHKFVTVYTNDAIVKEEPEMTIVEQYTGLTKERDLIIDSAQVTVEQAVAIIDRLNYRHCSFEYRHTTNDDIAEYRHFDAYRNGDKDAFAITEVVIDGLLDCVRFYNLFRNIRVDLKICKAEVKAEMTKISAKQVAEAKATIQLIKNLFVNGNIPDTELNSAVDHYNAAKAIVAASETTAEQIGLTINTALTNGKVSLKLDGNKISMANAFKAALAQDKAIVLRNEVGDFCIIDRDDDILTLGEFNFKTAIRQFANGEKVQGSTVMNKHQVHVIKAAQVEAQPEAEVKAAEVKADLSAPLARLAEVKVKVDRANEEHLKLSFAVHVSSHFYLNDLKSELFNNHIFPNQDRVREMLNPELDAIYDELVAIDHLNGCDEYGELLDYCVKTAATGSSNAVWRQARDIANEMLDKLGEQALADELKKIVDEYGISRDLLSKSGDCDFNPALFADKPELDDDPEPGEPKPELEGVYVDWEGEIIPAADYAEILDGLAITDYTTTAYRKNADGTFSEDRDAWQKIREVEGTCEVPVRSVEPEPAPTPEPAPEVINGETLEIIPDCLKDGATMIQVDSPKYGATLTRYSDGRIYYRITTPAEYPTPSTARNVTEEEFFQMLAQRGAWTPDEPPTDDFASEYARLQADVERAKSDRQRKQAALLKAQEAHEAAIKAESKAEARLQEFGQGKAQELNARLIDSTIVRARIALYSADGMELSTDPSQLDIDFYDGQFKITSCFERLGFYDTPAQVTEAIEQLKATIERGDRKFTFPTLEKLNPTVQEVAAKCARINSNAPADWSVHYDSERGDFAVEYKERRVGSLTAYQLVAAGARGFFDKYAA